MKKLYVTGALSVLLATAAIAGQAAPATDAVKPAEKTTTEKVKDAAVATKDAAAAATGAVADKVKAGAERVSDAVKPEAKKDEPKGAPEAKKAKTEGKKHHAKSGKAKKGMCADSTDLNGSTAVWHMPTIEETAKANAECKEVCHKDHGKKEVAHDAVKPMDTKEAHEAPAKPAEATVAKA